MEIWKDVIGWEGFYQVSNLWHVQSLWKTNQYWFWKRVKVLKKRIHRQWYIRYAFSKNWVIYNKSAHRLVAETFIENIWNKEMVNHKNWIKGDNRLENLEWVTRSENTKHSYHTLWNKNLRNAKPKYQKGESNKQSILIWQYTKEWVFIRSWLWVSEMKRQLWIHPYACLRWRKKTAGWFIWKYL